MKVVVNTSPFIALERIGQLNLLAELFGQVIRPQSVVDELQAGRIRYGLAECLHEAPWIETATDPPEMVLRRELGAGETAAIALAVRIRADLIILDDLAARNVAVELGLSVSGTLGVLLAAVKRRLIPDINPSLESLERCGFRISDSLAMAVRRAAER